MCEPHGQHDHLAAKGGRAHLCKDLLVSADSQSDRIHGAGLVARAAHTHGDNVFRVPQWISSPRRQPQRFLLVKHECTCSLASCYVGVGQTPASSTVEDFPVFGTAKDSPECHDHGCETGRGRCDTVVKIKKGRSSED